MAVGTVGLAVAIAVTAVAASLAVAAVAAGLGDEGQQGELAGALDGAGDLVLMTAAGARDPSRADLPALGYEPAQRADVLVVDLGDLVAAVRAGLAAPGAGAALLVPPPHAAISLLGHGRVWCARDARPGPGRTRRRSSLAGDHGETAPAQHHLAAPAHGAAGPGEPGDPPGA